MSPRSKSDLASLPLKPLVFQILLVLLERERHGYSIVREIEQRAGHDEEIEAGTLYRTLRTMMRDGLIVESDRRPDPELDDQRRRYFAVTRAGRATARAEARRLQGLLSTAEGVKLLEGRTGRV